MANNKEVKFYPNELCPHCGANIIWRERSPDGSSGCQNEHIFKSKDSLQLKSYQKPGDDHFIHELKCWPEYFQAKLDGRKLFEYRKNDRGIKYKEGHTVIEAEFIPKINPSEIEVQQRWEGIIRSEWDNFTGRQLKYTIGYVLHLPNDMVIFSVLCCREFFGKKSE